MPDPLQRAREIIDLETTGLTQLRDSLDASFGALVDACLKVLDGGGKIVIAGVGKSGHIGRKIAATLASTGSPAVFMHPVEAMHGDFGMLDQRDLLLALSYSGETDELMASLPAARRFEIPIVAVCADAESRLAHASDLVVLLPQLEEACPFNLAPTTSTTVMLVLGDALAMVLMETRNFSKEEYGQLHPAGAIGRAITLQVSDIMRGEERTPLVALDTTIKDALLKMTECRAGSVLVVDDDKRLLGIFTDGDFRRHAQEGIDGLMQRRISEIMTADPTVVRADQLAIDIVRMLETRNIDDIPVVDGDGRVVGMVDIQDLPKFKLMSIGRLE